MKNVEWNEDLAACQESNAEKEKANNELWKLYREARSEITHLRRLISKINSIVNT